MGVLRIHPAPLSSIEVTARITAERSRTFSEDIEAMDPLLTIRTAVQG